MSCLQARSFEPRGLSPKRPQRGSLRVATSRYRRQYVSPATVGTPNSCLPLRGDCPNGGEMNSRGSIRISIGRTPSYPAQVTDRFTNRRQQARRGLSNSRNRWEELEAPPGFEPGMEVLQTRKGHRRRLCRISDLAEMLENLALSPVTTITRIRLFVSRWGQKRDTMMRS